MKKTLGIILLVPLAVFGQINVGSGGAGGSGTNTITVRSNNVAVGSQAIVGLWAGSGATIHATNDTTAGKVDVLISATGSGTPGGNSADIQFNQSGAFAGTNTLVYDRTNQILFLKERSSAFDSGYRVDGGGGSLTNSLSAQGFAAYSGVLNFFPFKIVGSLLPRYELGTNAFWATNEATKFIDSGLIYSPWRTNWNSAVESTNFAMRGGSPGAGKVMTSDADGDATWGAPASVITNVTSLSTSNATSKPLTNSNSAGTVALFGLEAGANTTITPNGSNLVIATTGGAASTNNAVTAAGYAHAGTVEVTNGIYKRPLSLFVIGTNLVTGTNLSGRYVANLTNPGVTNIVVYPGSGLTELEVRAVPGVTVRLLVETNGSSVPDNWYVGGRAIAFGTNSLQQTLVQVSTNGNGTNYLEFTQDLVLVATNGVSFAWTNRLTGEVGVTHSGHYTGSATNAGAFRVTGVTTLESSLGVTGSSSLGGTVSLPGYSANFLLKTDGASDLTSSSIGVPVGTVVSNVQAIYQQTYTNYPAITVSNFVFSFLTNNYELNAYTNLNFTNIVGHHRSSKSDLVVMIRPLNQNCTVVWPAAGVNHLSYNWRTNANSTLWTTLTNNKVYVATIAAVGTNFFPSISLWE